MANPVVDHTQGWLRGKVLALYSLYLAALPRGKHNREEPKRTYQWMACAREDVRRMNF